MADPAYGSDPTLWELHRAVQQLRLDQAEHIKSLRDDLRSDITDLAHRIEQAVTKDVYAADQRAVQQRLDALAAEQETAARQREEDRAEQVRTRRWVISAFLAPLTVALLTLWLQTRGLGA